MNLVLQTPQYFIWLLALLELVLGLYILVLNPWHTANRHSGALLLLVALNSYALGLLAAASGAAQAALPGILLASCMPAIQALLVAATIAIIKPAWQRGAARWLRAGLLLLTVLPFILTTFDLRASHPLWYTGIPAGIDAVSSISLARFTTGSLAPVILTISNRVLPVLGLLLLAYFAAWDRQLSRSTRSLARILLLALAAAHAIQFFLSQGPAETGGILLSTVIYAGAYAYAGLRQMVAERRLQRGSLQVRLTALSLVVTVPLLVTVAIFVTDRAGALLEQKELQTLRAGNRSLALAASQWLQASGRSLQQLAAQPEITSMVPARQQSALQAMAAVYPDLISVSTYDYAGAELAGSKDGPLENAAGQAWFQAARQADGIVWQVQPGEAGNLSVLRAASPILDETGALVGLAAFTTRVDNLAAQLMAARSSLTSQFVLVDDHNRLVAASGGMNLTPLLDLSSYPPLSALRRQQSSGAAAQSGSELAHAFSGQDGQKWRSQSTGLENGWAVVALQPESDLLVNVMLFRRLAAGTIGLSIVLLLAMSWITIRQALRPIASLTETVSGIAQGDLTRVAVIETDDEIGLLARTFNSMTSQVRELVTTLERRVTERTRELERRALQLQVTAEVAGEAAAIRDLEQLLLHTVHLISDRFNFYHAGIFLLDETGKYAVLRAASSEGGQHMLARGHRLEVGQVGIVGNAAATGEPHIALDVGADAVFFNNPDLPQTRSEMALPLKVHQRMIGVLDVQSTKSGAFTDEDIEILRTLANQLALAIDNARLFADSQSALEELQELYQQQVARAWRRRLEHQPLAYHYTRRGVHPIEPVPLPEEPDAWTLVAPIVLRGQSLGALVLRRSENQPVWSPDEVEMVRATVAQVALTLENVRLLEENRRRAMNEQMIGHITARTQSLLDLEAVMKTAVQEIGQALGDARVQIRLANGDGNSSRLSPGASPNG